MGCRAGRKGWLALLATAVVGCAASGGHPDALEATGGSAYSIPSGPDAERSPEGLVRVLTRDPRLGSLWVRPPRPYLLRFDRVMLVPARIEYKASVRGWDAQREKRLRRHFDSSLHRTLARSPGWKLSREPGPGVLLASIAAVELDVKVTQEFIGSDVHYVSSGGEVVLVLELRDSVSEELLLRFVERRALPGGVFSGDIDHERVKRAFTRFAADLADQLDNYYAAARQIEQIERERGAPVAAPPPEP